MTASIRRQPQSGFTISRVSVCSSSRPRRSRRDSEPSHDHRQEPLRSEGKLVSTYGFWEGCRTRQLTSKPRFPRASTATRPEHAEGCRSRTKVRTLPTCQRRDMTRPETRRGLSFPGENANASHVPAPRHPRGHAERVNCRSRTKMRTFPRRQRRDTPQDTRGLSFADERPSASRATC